MTGISERKSQWESEAIEAERKMIAEWLRSLKDDEPHISRAVILTVTAGAIERGEYRKTEAGE